MDSFQIGQWGPTIQLIIHELENQNMENFCLLCHGYTGATRESYLSHMGQRAFCSQLSPKTQNGGGLLRIIVLQEHWTQVRLHTVNPEEFGPGEALHYFHDCKMAAVGPSLSQPSFYHMQCRT